MYFRNLFVLDFARRFFVSCAQISEAYAVRTLMKFGGDWQKIGRKSRCRKDSESTSYYTCQWLAEISVSHSYLLLIVHLQTVSVHFVEVIAVLTA